jgi:hypothetical protein
MKSGCLVRTHLSTSRDVNWHCSPGPVNSILFSVPNRKMALLRVNCFLEMGHVNYKKIDNFILISKFKLTLVKTMLPKTLDRKNKVIRDFSKFLLKILFFKTFSEFLLSERHVYILSINIKFSIFIPNITNLRI